MESEEYMTIREVADKLKVAYFTVYKWVNEGKLEAVRIPSTKRVLIRREDLARRFKPYQR